MKTKEIINELDYLYKWISYYRKDSYNYTEEQHKLYVQRIKDLEGFYMDNIKSNSQDAKILNRLEKLSFTLEDLELNEDKIQKLIEDLYFEKKKPTLAPSERVRMVDDSDYNKLNAKKSGFGGVAVTPAMHTWILSQLIKDK